MSLRLLRNKSRELFFDFHKKKFKKLFLTARLVRRAVSLATCLVFVLTSAVPAQILGSAVASSLGMAPLAKNLDVSTISIPENLGRVVDRHIGNQPDQIVIQIQDAHTSYDAQRNIQRIIAHIERHYGLGAVAFEGAEGELDPFIFRSFPDRRVMETVLDRYVRLGELSGVDLAASINFYECRYLGIEDQDIYDAGVAAFLDAQKASAEALRAFNRIEDLLTAIQRRVYSPQLKEISEKLRDYENGRLDLGSLLIFLKQFGDPPKDSELSRLFSVAPDGSGKKREAERLINRLEAREILREVRAWAGRVKKQFFKTGQEFKVDEAETALYLLKDLASLQIAPEQLHAYFSDKAAYGAERFQSFLAEMGEDAHISFDVTAAVLFYRNAVVRDQVLAHRLITLIADKKYKVAAFVGGGFHTPGISERLRAEGVSYVTVMPAMSDMNRENRYLDVMRGDISYSERFEKNSKGEVDLYKAFAEDVTEGLAGKLTQHDAAAGLKEWRDSIIRSLAARGRAADAHRYTYFIDKLMESKIQRKGAMANRSGNIEEEVEELLRAFSKSAFARYRRKVLGEFNALLNRMKSLDHTGLLNMANFSKLLGPENSSIAASASHPTKPGFLSLQGRRNDDWLAKIPERLEYTADRREPDSVSYIPVDSEPVTSAGFGAITVESVSEDLDQFTAKLGQWRKIARQNDLAEDANTRGKLDEKMKKVNTRRNIAFSHLNLARKLLNGESRDGTLQRDLSGALYHLEEAIDRLRKEALRVFRLRASTEVQEWVPRSWLAPASSPIDWDYEEISQLNSAKDIGKALAPADLEPMSSRQLPRVFRWSGPEDSTAMFRKREKWLAPRYLIKLGLHLGGLANIATQIQILMGEPSVDFQTPQADFRQRLTTDIARVVNEIDLFQLDFEQWSDVAFRNQFDKHVLAEAFKRYRGVKQLVIKGRFAQAIVEAKAIWQRLETAAEVYRQEKAVFEVVVVPESERKPEANFSRYGIIDVTRVTEDGKRVVDSILIRNFSNLREEIENIATGIAGLAELQQGLEGAKTKPDSGFGVGKETGVGILPRMSAGVAVAAQNYVRAQLIRGAGFGAALSRREFLAAGAVGLFCSACDRVMRTSDRAPEQIDGGPNPPGEPGNSLTFKDLRDNAERRALKPYAEFPFTPDPRFDPPASEKADDVGLVFEEANAIRRLTPNYASTDFRNYVVARATTSADIGRFENVFISYGRILSDDPGVVTFSPALWRRSDYDYGNPAIQPPLPQEIPADYQSFSQINLGGKVPGGEGFPVLFDVNAIGYAHTASASARESTVFGTSLRWLLHFGTQGAPAGGRPETSEAFPELRNIYIVPSANSQVSEAWMTFSAPAYEAVIRARFYQGSPSFITVKGTLIPRRDIPAREKVGIGGFSSFFGSNERYGDFYHDYDRIITIGEGGERNVTAGFHPAQITLDRLSNRVNGEKVAQVFLEQNNRDPDSYRRGANYHHRASVGIQFPRAMIGNLEIPLEPYFYTFPVSPERREYEDSTVVLFAVASDLKKGVPLDFEYTVQTYRSNPSLEPFDGSLPEPGDQEIPSSLAEALSGLTNGLPFAGRMTGDALSAFANYEARPYGFYSSEVSVPARGRRFVIIPVLNRSVTPSTFKIEMPGLLPETGVFLNKHEPAAPVPADGEWYLLAVEIEPDGWIKHFAVSDISAPFRQYGLFLADEIPEGRNVIRLVPAGFGASHSRRDFLLALAGSGLAAWAAAAFSPELVPLSAARNQPQSQEKAQFSIEPNTDLAARYREAAFDLINQAKTAYEKSPDAFRRQFGVNPSAITPEHYRRIAELYMLTEAHESGDGKYKGQVNKKGQVTGPGMSPASIEYQSIAELLSRHRVEFKELLGNEWTRYQLQKHVLPIRYFDPTYLKKQTNTKREQIRALIKAHGIEVGKLITDHLPLRIAFIHIHYFSRALARGLEGFNLLYPDSIRGIAFRWARDYNGVAYHTMDEALAQKWNPKTVEEKHVFRRRAAMVEQFEERAEAYRERLSSGFYESYFSERMVASPQAVYAEARVKVAEPRSSEQMGARSSVVAEVASEADVFADMTGVFFSMSKFEWMTGLLGATASYIFSRRAYIAVFGDEKESGAGFGTARDENLRRALESAAVIQSGKGTDLMGVRKYLEQFPQFRIHGTLILNEKRNQAAVLYGNQFIGKSALATLMAGFDIKGSKLVRARSSDWVVAAQPFLDAYLVGDQLIVGSTVLWARGRIERRTPSLQVISAKEETKAGFFVTPVLVHVKRLLEEDETQPPIVIEHGKGISFDENFKLVNGARVSFTQDRIDVSISAQRIIEDFQPYADILGNMIEQRMVGKGFGNEVEKDLEKLKQAIARPESWIYENVHPKRLSTFLEKGSTAEQAKVYPERDEALKRVRDEKITALVPFLVEELRNTRSKEPEPTRNAEAFYYIRDLLETLVALNDPGLLPVLFDFLTDQHADYRNDVRPYFDPQNLLNMGPEYAGAFVLRAAFVLRWQNQMSRGGEKNLSYIRELLPMFSAEQTGAVLTKGQTIEFGHTEGRMVLVLPSLTAESMKTGIPDNRAIVIIEKTKDGLYILGPESPVMSGTYLDLSRVGDPIHLPVHAAPFAFQDPPSAALKPRERFERIKLEYLSYLPEQNMIIIGRGTESENHRRLVLGIDPYGRFLFTTLSRDHVEIEITPSNTVRVRDLSKNGTQIIYDIPSGLLNAESRSQHKGGTGFGTEIRAEEGKNDLSNPRAVAEDMLRKHPKFIDMLPSKIVTGQTPLPDNPEDLMVLLFGSRGLIKAVQKESVPEATYEAFDRKVLTNVAARISKRLWSDPDYESYFFEVLPDRLESDYRAQGMDERKMERIVYGLLPMFAVGEILTAMVQIAPDVSMKMDEEAIERTAELVQEPAEVPSPPELVRDVLATAPAAEEVPEPGEVVEEKVTVKGDVWSSADRAPLGRAAVGRWSSGARAVGPGAGSTSPRGWRGDGWSKYMFSRWRNHFTPARGEHVTLTLGERSSFTLDFDRRNIFYRQFFDTVAFDQNGEIWTIVFYDKRDVPGILGLPVGGKFDILQIGMNLFQVTPGSENESIEFKSLTGTGSLSVPAKVTHEQKHTRYSVSLRTLADALSETLPEFSGFVRELVESAPAPGKGFGSSLAEPPDARQLGEVLTTPEKSLLEPNDLWWRSNGFTTPGAFRLNGKVYLIARGIDEHGVSRLGLAVSSDGHSIEKIFEEPIFVPAGLEQGVENPRVTILGDRIYMLYTARRGRDKFQLELASISREDFLSGLKEGKWESKWQRHDIEFADKSRRDSNDRNAAIFPQKIGSEYVMYFRDEDLTGTRREIRIAYAERPDGPWDTGDDTSAVLTPEQLEKRLAQKPEAPIVWVGVGGPPLLTKDGWFTVFHYVDEDRIYRMGFFIADRNHPEKIIYLHDRPIWELGDAYYDLAESHQLLAIPRAKVVATIVRRINRFNLSGFFGLVDAATFRRMKGHDVPVGDRYTLHVSGLVPEFEKRMIQPGDPILLYGGVFNTDTGLGIFEYPELGDLIARETQTKELETTVLSGKKILVAEDDAKIRSEIVKALREIGKVEERGGQIFAPSTKEELQHILEQVHSRRLSFDAVIADHDIQKFGHIDIKRGTQVLNILRDSKGYIPPTIYYSNRQSLENLPPDEARTLAGVRRIMKEMEGTKPLRFIVSPEQIVRQDFPALLRARENLPAETVTVSDERIVDIAYRLLGPGVEPKRKSLGQSGGEEFPLQEIRLADYGSKYMNEEMLDRSFGGGLILVYAKTPPGAGENLREGDRVIFVHQDNNVVRTGLYDAESGQLHFVDRDVDHRIYFGPKTRILYRTAGAASDRDAGQAKGLLTEAQKKMVIDHFQNQKDPLDELSERILGKIRLVNVDSDSDEIAPHLDIVKALFARTKDEALGSIDGLPHEAERYIFDIAQKQGLDLTAPGILDQHAFLVEQISIFPKAANRYVDLVTVASKPEEGAGETPKVRFTASRDRRIGDEHSEGEFEILMKYKGKQVVHAPPLQTPYGFVEAGHAGLEFPVIFKEYVPGEDIETIIKKLEPKGIRTDEFNVLLALAHAIGAYAGNYYALTGAWPTDVAWKNLVVDSYEHPKGPFAARTVDLDDETFRDASSEEGFFDLVSFTGDEFFEWAERQNNLRLNSFLPKLVGQMYVSMVNEIIRVIPDMSDGKKFEYAREFLDDLLKYLPAQAARGHREVIKDVLEKMRAGREKFLAQAAPGVNQGRPIQRSAEETRAVELSGLLDQAFGPGPKEERTYTISGRNFDVVAADKYIRAGDFVFIDVNDLDSFLQIADRQLYGALKDRLVPTRLEERGDKKILTFEDGDDMLLLILSMLTQRERIAGKNVLVMRTRSGGVLTSLAFRLGARHVLGIEPFEEHAVIARKILDQYDEQAKEVVQIESTSVEKFLEAPGALSPDIRFDVAIFNLAQAGAIPGLQTSEQDFYPAVLADHLTGISTVFAGGAEDNETARRLENQLIQRGFEVLGKSRLTLSEEQSGGAKEKIDIERDRLLNILFQKPAATAGFGAEIFDKHQLFKDREEIFRLAIAAMQALPVSVRPLGKGGKPGALIFSSDTDRLFVVGDLHGRARPNLEIILRKIDYEKTLKNLRNKLAILGDAVHYGSYYLYHRNPAIPPRAEEVKAAYLDSLLGLLMIADLIRQYPGQVFYFPGNHDYAYVHDSRGKKVLPAPFKNDENQGEAFEEAVREYFGSEKGTDLLKLYGDFVRSLPLIGRFGPEPVRSKDHLSVSVVHAGPSFAIPGLPPELRRAFEIGSRADMIDLLYYAFEVGEEEFGRDRVIQHEVLERIIGQLLTSRSYGQSKPLIDMRERFNAELEADLTLSGHTIPNEYAEEHGVEIIMDGLFGRVRDQQLLLDSQNGTFAYMDLNLRQPKPKHLIELLDGNGQGASALKFDFADSGFGSSKSFKQVLPIESIAPNVASLLDFNPVKVRSVLVEIQSKGFGFVRARLERELSDALKREEQTARRRLNAETGLKALAQKIVRDSRTWTPEVLRADLEGLGIVMDDTVLGDFALLVNRLRFALERFELAGTFEHYALRESDKHEIEERLDSMRSIDPRAFQLARQRVMVEFNLVLAEHRFSQHINSNAHLALGYEKDAAPGSRDAFERFVLAAFGGQPRFSGRGGKLDYFYKGSRGVLNEISVKQTGKQKTDATRVNHILSLIDAHRVHDAITPANIRDQLDDRGVLVVSSLNLLEGGTAKNFPAGRVVIYPGRAFDESDETLSFLSEKVDEVAKLISQGDQTANESLLRQIADYGFAFRPDGKGGQFIFVDRAAFVASLELAFATARQTAAAA